MIGMFYLNNMKRTAVRFRKWMESEQKHMFYN